MTAAEFRKMALSLPETEERSHMNHPDFRVGGKIFATLGYPTKEWGMVRLVPGQQEMFVEQSPKTFAPVKGAWGRKGATSVNLKAAGKKAVREALAAAWENVAPEAMREQKGTGASAKKKSTMKSAR